MEITLPESQQRFVDARAPQRGFASANEYLSALVRSDELEAAKEDLRAKLMAGVNSGPGRDFGEVLDEMQTRLRAHQRLAA